MGLFGTICDGIKKRMDSIPKRFDYYSAMEDLEQKIAAAQNFRGSEEDRIAAFDAAYKAGAYFIGHSFDAEDNPRYSYFEQCYLRNVEKEYIQKLAELDQIRPAGMKSFDDYPLGGSDTE